MTLATQEGSAYGPALLALAGSGDHGSIEEVRGVAIRETERVGPCATDAAVYAKGHSVYQALYPALQPLYARM